ncbi:MAG TPA: DsrE family protein [Azoarcus sp.]|nr:DsrE family protein [Azoarcus sp.]
MATRSWYGSVQKSGISARNDRAVAMALFGKQPLRFVLALFFTLLACTGMSAQAADFAPYGKASTALDVYPDMDLVFDVNYSDPQDLHVLYGFVRNAQRHVQGRKVLVLHGPELRAFAREHYETYQPVIDRMAELARDGVEFRMCNDALRAAGYEPDDMHGFVTVIASGFPEIALLQQQGFRYINPVPLNVADLRRRHPAD